MPNDVSVGTVTVLVALWLLKEVATFTVKLVLERHKDTLARAMNKRLWMVGFDFLAVGYLIWAGFFLFNSGEPATRRDVLFGAGWTLMVAISVLSLFDDLIQWAKAMRALAPATAE
jgi:hypothetical protein